MMLAKYPSLVNARSKTSLTPLAYSFSSEIIPISHYEELSSKHRQLGKVSKVLLSAGASSEGSNISDFYTNFIIKLFHLFFS